MSAKTERRRDPRGAAPPGLRAARKRWSCLRPLLPAAVLAAAFPACLAGEGPLVAFLGDSLTSGWLLRQDEAWPALLGRARAASRRPIRVLNAGVNRASVCPGKAARSDRARLSIEAAHPG